MKKLLFLLILFPIILQGQEKTENRWSVEGKVVNSTNQEPVHARIVYESLPYGGSIGFLTGDNFSFHIPKETSYRIMIEAEGFSSYTYEIDPHEFQEGHFFTVVELKPTGPNQLIRLDKLIFDQGRAAITVDSYAELNMIVEMLNKYPAMIIQLEGHTDFRGNQNSNMRLSEARVEAVKHYLVEQGIEKKRIKTKSFGGQFPLSRESDAPSRERNRRVEVRIISNGI